MATTGKEFYLFGSQAVRMYDDEGFDSLLQHVTTGGEYGVFVFEYGVTETGELLGHYDGWDGYTTITEEEFNILVRLN